MLLLLTFLAPVTNAETLGHWKFNGSGFLNDAVGSNALIVNPLGEWDTADAVTQISDEAVFNGTGVLDSGQSYAFAGSSGFALEMFVELTALPTGRVALASQYESSDRSWELYTNDAGGIVLELAFAAGNGRFYSATDANAAFTLAVDKRYYLAVEVDLTNLGNDNCDVTFRLQNLTDSGALQSVTVSRTDQSDFVGNSVNFTIGGRAGNSNGNKLSAIIDRVRLSSGLLSSGDRLVDHPESGGYLIWLQ